MTSQPNLDRTVAFKTALALLLDHRDDVGCYDRQGQRLSDDVPAIGHARAVWARRRIDG